MHEYKQRIYGFIGICPMEVFTFMIFLIITVHVLENSWIEASKDSDIKSWIVKNE